jgi:hypothetical protein
VFKDGRRPAGYYLKARPRGPQATFLEEEPEGADGGAPGPLRQHRAGRAVGDLLKTTRASQIFTVFGQPDVEVRHVGATLVVALPGFHICQAFFPGDDKAWEKLQLALKAQIDSEALEKMPGTVSFPFQSSERGRIAVKVIDFRRNEVVRVVSLSGKGGRYD